MKKREGDPQNLPKMLTYPNLSGGGAFVYTRPSSWLPPREVQHHAPREAKKHAPDHGFVAMTEVGMFQELNEQLQLKLQQVEAQKERAVAARSRPLSCGGGAGCCAIGAFAMGALAKGALGPGAFAIGPGALALALALAKA